MARKAKLDIEKEFYDVFSGWMKEDRAAAIRVLQTLHPRLPDNPKAKDLEHTTLSNTALASNG